MDVGLLKELLEKLRDGSVDVDEGLERLRTLPFEDIGFASIDHHRHLRRGFPEVIYGRRKKVEHIIKIMEKMSEKGKTFCLPGSAKARQGLLKSVSPKVNITRTRGSSP